MYSESRAGTGVLLAPQWAGGLQLGGTRPAGAGLAPVRSVLGQRALVEWCEASTRRETRLLPRR